MIESTSYITQIIEGSLHCTHTHISQDYSEEQLWQRKTLNKLELDVLLLRFAGSLVTGCALSFIFLKTEIM